MTVRISRATLAHMVALAQASPDCEVCGLLVGQGEGITGHVPAANVADDPATRFEIDPAVLIAAHRAARSGGPAVLGCYHSHPSGAEEPSACDAAMAASDGGLWLILTPASHSLWRAGEGGLHGRFRPQHLCIDEASGEVVLASGAP